MLALEKSSPFPPTDIRSASAIGKQSGNQLWPGRCHTPKVTFSNAVFIALISAEKAREMEVREKAKGEVRRLKPGGVAICHTQEAEV